ncbi:MAG: proline--tRNA ligase [Anaerolineaceae bacterium]|nr:proline--tRNA ligase [Anaerolineaceae bacterium]
MYLSKLFTSIKRETPANAEIASHQLLLRAGFIHQQAAGIFSYLPLARRSMNKIENILHEEIQGIGGQEITMPVIHSADIWKKTGRWYQVGSEMGRFKDKNDHDMVLAMTHEEIVAELTGDIIRSYRQLPALVYHIQTKWRDDPRPRAGLIRVREFTMLDSYSLDTNPEGLEEQYQAHYDAYFRIFERCGLPVISVLSDTGMMGGKKAHEYMYLTPVGEDTLILCDECAYAANRQIAKFSKELFPKEDLLPMEEVATPNASSIEELAAFLDIPKHKTAKAVFFMALIDNPDDNTASEKFVFTVIRGDMDINETKVAQVIKAKELRPATDEEIKAIGAIPGYASPLGIKEAMVIVDDSIPESCNLVAGANKPGYHMRNVNYGRDFQAVQIADIAAADEGHKCPNCGNALTTSRGVEVGNIFQLGTKYTNAVGASYLDINGRENDIYMGSYGIGVGRLLACLAEEHHDDYGLIWPGNVAPYAVHLVLLQDKEGKCETLANELYQTLKENKLEALYDNQKDSAGVKFNSADLIGIPVRITVSQRALNEGGVELKLRNQKEKQIVPADQLVETIKGLLK